MVELVRMKALRSWRNDEFEGAISLGREFLATELRARELERGGLAARLPALSGQTVKVDLERKMEFGRPLSAPAGQNRRASR